MHVAAEQTDAFPHAAQTKAVGRRCGCGALAVVLHVEADARGIRVIQHQLRPLRAGVFTDVGETLLGGAQQGVFGGGRNGARRAVDGDIDVERRP